MKLVYDNGPDTIKLDKYLFTKEVPLEVPDEVGKLLLKKTIVIFRKVKATKTKTEEIEDGIQY